MYGPLTLCIGRLSSAEIRSRLKALIKTWKNTGYKVSQCNGSVRPCPSILRRVSALCVVRLNTILSLLLNRPCHLLNVWANRL